MTGKKTVTGRGGRISLIPQTDDDDDESRKYKALCEKYKALWEGIDALESAMITSDLDRYHYDKFKSKWDGLGTGWIQQDLHAYGGRDWDTMPTNIRELHAALREINTRPVNRRESSKSKQKKLASGGAGPARPINARRRVLDRLRALIELIKLIEQSKQSEEAEPIELPEHTDQEIWEWNCTRLAQASNCTPRYVQHLTKTDLEIKSAWNEYQFLVNQRPGAKDRRRKPGTRTKNAN